MSQKENKPGFDFKNHAGLILVGVLILLFLFFFSLAGRNSVNEISYSDFLIQLRSGAIDNVTILDMREIRGNLNDGTQITGFKTIIPYFDEELMKTLQNSGAKVVGAMRGVSIGSVLLQLLPVILLFAFLFWMYRSMRGGGKGAMSFGRSNAKLYEGGDSPVTFRDVAGQIETKFELEEVVEFLKRPERFTLLGAKIPKGVLLVGPPGTGKTLLAKAVAGEAGVPFFHMSGSDFVEMFVGVGASRVRDLFDQGRKNAPCILFIDEIDAVGRTRGAGYGGGHDEREQTLNQLLVEMDGFKTDRGVIIIAATNRPDVLDPALLRPGRFDRQITVSMPDVSEREAIFAIHAQKIKLDKDVDMSRTARMTPGSSGADIANIVNEAALFAGRAGRKSVKMRDFEEARDKILMGVARRSLVMTDQERRMTAYHEAGHALLHYTQEKSDPIHKVTIIPRGRALGVTLSLPEKDEYSKNMSSLKARLVILYGGFAAEELVFGETTTGAQNDIRQATDLARKMVCEWGMSPLGPVALGNGDEPIFIGRELAQHADYSDGTADRIDAEIHAFLIQALNVARETLQKDKNKLDILAQALVDRETLDDREIRNLLELEQMEIHNP